MVDPASSVRQLRLVITVDDFDAAMALYRDQLGLRVEAAFDAPGRRVVIFDAGRATLEVGDRGHAAYIDDVEVGSRVAGAFRIAFEIDGVDERTDDLVRAGARLLAPPTQTPWGSRNSRLVDPCGVQLTLFENLEPERMA